MIDRPDQQDSVSIDLSDFSFDHLPVYISERGKQGIALDSLYASAGKLCCQISLKGRSDERIFYIADHQDFLESAFESRVFPVRLDAGGYAAGDQQ